MSSGVIAIVGSPGTGKKTVARALASKMQLEYLDVNEVAIAKGAAVAREGGEYIISTSKLRRILLPIIRGRRLILSGHLLPSVLKRDEVEVAILLRCAPEVLEVRLAARGYSEAKVRENVAAEVLGVVAAEAIKAFGVDKVSEHDTTNKSVEEAVSEIIDVIQGRAPLNRPSIDWLSEVAEKGLLKKYFP
jgi:adenylate kinase